ncbi:glycosyltransferase involved in cell wall biosynthesis [Lewinella aquimaris]|uniref:Glycosyltransferase involved in cell wall biosynthesis n=1 Tax=Neolewinella aquimaris TaxID=1835722 RepID=A0A840E4E8_9BACT|nr:glycosyltransferase [Neolewinella aquimaris]MBB4080494.1 glycosyltransferase involved in cell wall biosynthesis [Neolewinella aquimaris]
MPDKKKILLVTRDQFGYHVDPYAYARELTRHFEVTYFCWDYGRPRVEAPGVEVIYSNRNGNLVVRNLRFLRELRDRIPDFAVTLIFYFTGASLVLPGMGHLKDRLICDVRTGSVSGKVTQRLSLNTLLKAEVKAFRYQSFISESLGKSLGFTRFNVLPLGASITAAAPRSYDTLHLIYVGTLEGRHLDESIVGLGKFYQRHTGVACKYTIVGSGSEADVQKVRTAIARYGLEEIVEMTGFIQRDKIGTYLGRANVGVSYVPITDYYNFQPVTKTYEYFLAGLPVIATATHEHKLIVEPHNGVLIESTPESFAEGLEEVYRRRSEYSAAVIRARAAHFSYAHIVDTRLVLYLRAVLGEKATTATDSRRRENISPP